MFDFNLLKNNNVVIFGTGEKAEELILILKKHKINILFLLDNNYYNWNSQKWGYDIFNPNYLKDSSYEGFIIISSISSYYKIKLQLENYNLKNLTILNCHDFGEMKINRFLIDNIRKNHFLMKEITFSLYNHKEKFFISSYLKILYKELSECLSEKEKTSILNIIINSLNFHKNSFKKNIFILSLCVLLKELSTKISSLIMKILLKDTENLEYHYAVLYNLRFYEKHLNMKANDNIHLLKREEVKKLADYYKKNNFIKFHNKKTNDNEYKIAIHCYLLTSTLQGFTKLTLGLAKNLKRLFPNYKIKIFVEDNFKMKPEEIIFPNYYESSSSLIYKSDHLNYLLTDDIDIYYPNHSLKKGERIKELVENINSFNPDIIYSTCDISISREILYPYYPIVFQSYGGTNFSTLSDAYILYSSSQKENWIKINNVLNIIDESKIFINEPAFSEIQENSILYKKSDFNLPKNSFVLITVGNRLDVELNDKFIDNICTFINKNNDVYWIIIGPKKISYIHSYYNNLLKNNKIIFKSYEENLPAIYKNCDVYINPPRKGGAGSISIAVNENLPVIVEKNSQDGVFVIGEENCVEDSSFSYYKELEKIYTDSEYKIKKAELQKQKIIHSNKNKHFVDLIKIFELAQKNFNIRKCKK